MGEKKYSVILADPPWHYRVYSKKGMGRSAESHYPTMDIEDIKALPVADIADKDCALFLWVTFPCLLEGLEVIKAWGFTYKTVAFVWVKQNKKSDSLFWGMGYWTRSNAELCILATKGAPKRVNAGVHQVVVSHIEEHSRKPIEVHHRINQLMGDVPKIELFARRKTDGFDVWGNEVECDIELTGGKKMQLVVTEKPSVAQAISRVIGAGERKDGYMEGNNYIVSWCIGHLVELAQPDAYSDTWKKWSYESLPMIPEEWQTEVKSGTAAQYKVLKGLMHREDVTAVICGTDAGREGELIFRLVYEMAGCDKPMKRLWISSMEESAIREGFENLRPGSDYDNLYHSALCRQRADWLVGLNGTRLFTVLYGGKVLKVGRVQTPTLAMLVEREEKIRNFKKEQYYMAHILMDRIDAATERVDDKAQAEAIAAACESKAATVLSVTKEKKTVQPPKLYDLTTLQRDANRLFGFTAKQTLEYTQSLYEKKLVTYPRTDSQYLSDDMEDTARGVIGAVYKAILFEEQTGAEPDIKRVMDSKKVTDHHAIIPTMEIAVTDFSAVPEGEMKILSLAANRLLCATGEKHEYETVKAEFDCNGSVFTVSGKSITRNGWKDFEAAFRRSYKTSEDKEKEEKKLPELSEGMVFEGVQTKVTEHFTQPPKHFTEDLLLSAMERAGSEDIGADAERRGLGTPATRADVIEKLVKDGFVKREKKQMIPTEDGVKLIAVLPDVVKSPKLTADWENALTLVSKGEYSMQEFMGGIEDMVNRLVQTYRSVSDEQKSMFGGSNQESLGKCPKCGGDVVKGKFGAYCKNKCGMNVSRAMGAALTDSQVKSMLEGKKTLVKGLKGKKGSYDAYLIPEGVEDYSYTKDGKEIRGFQYKIKLEFPKREKKGEH